MTIKGVAYLKSTSPITVLATPSSETVELIGKLSQDAEFQFVKIMRRKFGLPEDGLDITEFIGKDFKELPYMDNEFVDHTFQIVSDSVRQEVGLSDEFIPQMKLLVFFNAIVDVKYFDGFISHPIKFILGKKNIASSMFDYPNEIGAITIPFNISQNQLTKWIKDNWESIKTEMDENLTTNPYILKMHKNTQIALEVIELKENKKLSYAQICDELTNKYPKDERVSDEAWVKKMYHDYKQILSIHN